MSAFKKMWFWRSDYGGIQANNELPKKQLLFSEKLQTKACQLQNRDRLDGRIIAVYRQITSYTNYKKSKHCKRHYLLAEKWPEQQA